MISEYFRRLTSCFLFLCITCFMAPYFRSLIRVWSFELISPEARILQQTKDLIRKCVEKLKDETQNSTINVRIDR